MFKASNFTAMLDQIARTFGTDKLMAYADTFKGEINHSYLEGVGNYPPRSFHSYVNETNKYMATPTAIDLLEKMLVIDHVRDYIRYFLYKIYTQKW